MCVLLANGTCMSEAALYLILFVLFMNRSTLSFLRHPIGPCHRSVPPPPPFPGPSSASARRAEALHLLAAPRGSPRLLPGRRPLAPSLRAAPAGFTARPAVGGERERAGKRGTPPEDFPCRFRGGAICVMRRAQRGRKPFT